MTTENSKDDNSIPNSNMSEEHRKVLDKSPEELGATKKKVSMSLFQGPLPPPDIFADYERALSGSGQAILDNWGTEMNHRHVCDKSAIELDKRANELSYKQSRNDHVAHIFERLLGLLLIFGILFFTGFFAKDLGPEYAVGGILLEVIGLGYIYFKTNHTTRSGK